MQEYDIVQQYHTENISVLRKTGNAAHMTVFPLLFFAGLIKDLLATKINVEDMFWYPAAATNIASYTLLSTNTT